MENEKEADLGAQWASPFLASVIVGLHKLGGKFEDMELRGGERVKALDLRDAPALGRLLGEHCSRLPIVDVKRLLALSHRELEQEALKAMPGSIILTGVSASAAELLSECMSRIPGGIYLDDGAAAENVDDMVFDAGLAWLFSGSSFNGVRALPKDGSLLKKEWFGLATQDQEIGWGRAVLLDLSKSVEALVSAVSRHPDAMAMLGQRGLDLSSDEVMGPLLRRKRSEAEARDIGAEIGQAGPKRVRPAL